MSAKHRGFQTEFASLNSRQEKIMTQYSFLVLCSFAVIASALVSGIFMAFSDFGMKSLGAATPSGGIESMQIINRDVYNSIFIKLLIGVAPFGILLTATGYFHLPTGASAWLATAATIYLVGVIFVTLKFNVPMNQKLDIMDFTSAEAAFYWKTYLTDWTRWNHVRTIASGISAVCFLVACIEIARILPR